MASNDPTDTGGLFVGRRPGTAPLKYRDQPVTAGPGRRGADKFLSGLILFVETVLCLTLWGPQPAAWLWVGSQVDYKTDSVALGITVAFAGMLTTLFLTLSVARRLDLAWKLVRRAAGEQGVRFRSACASSSPVTTGTSGRSSRRQRGPRARQAGASGPASPATEQAAPAAPPERDRDEAEQSKTGERATAVELYYRGQEAPPDREPDGNGNPDSGRGQREPRSGEETGS